MASRLLLPFLETDQKMEQLLPCSYRNPMTRLISLRFPPIELFAPRTPKPLAYCSELLKLGVE